MKTPDATKTVTWSPHRLCAGKLFRLPVIAVIGILFPGVLFAEQVKLITSIAECLVNVRSVSNSPASLKISAVVTLLDRERGLMVVQDDSAAMAVATTLANLTSLRVGQKIVLEGPEVLPYFRSFPAYPEQPSERSILASFETPSGRGGHYLTRIRGYLHPPVSGSYTFWVAADDVGELCISPDASPERMTKIAGAGVGNSTGLREWDRHPLQRSQPVPLQAGESYYVEALHVQSYGRDCFAVAWEGPGLARSVIEGRHLTPWVGSPTGKAQPAEISQATNGLLGERWTNYFAREYEALRTRNAHESIVRIPALKLTPLEGGALPAPQWIDSYNHWEAVPNLGWVEVEGDVSFVAGDEGKLQFELKRNDSLLTVQVLSWKGPPKEKMLHSRVRVRGVLEQASGSGGEVTGTVLWSPDEQQVSVLEAPASQTDLVRQVSICDLNPTDPEMRWGRRVSVRGRIIQQSVAQTVLQGGDHFMAFCSRDGSNWMSLGKAVEIGISNSALIGLAVVSRHTTEQTYASFSHPSGVETNWLGAKIGDPAQPGSFSLHEGTVTMTGGGRKIGERGDQFYYLHQPALDEMEVRTRLMNLVCTNATPQAGLMLRESLDSRSKFAMVLFTPNIGPTFQYRRHLGEPIIGFEPRREFAEYRWLKLIRRKSLLQIQGGAQAGANTNQVMNVTGALTWKDGTPILTEAFFETALDENSAPPPPLSEPIRSTSSFATRALHPPEPYLQGRMTSPLLRGVVTFCGEFLGTNLMFIQSGDESGIQIGWEGIRPNPKFAVGQLIELTGYATVRKFPVILQPTDLKSAGWGTLPKPEPYSADLIKGENAQARWVEATGVVRSQDTNGVLSLMTKHGSLAVWVGDSHRADTSRYVDAALRVRGVLSLDAARNVHLLVPSPKFVEVQELAPPDPFAIPRFSIAELTAVKEKPERLRRMKLTGTVTCRLPQGLYVQDETGGAFVRADDATPVQLGDQIEAVGFPDNSSMGGTLTEAKIHKTGGGTMPVPQPVLSTTNLLERKFPSMLVTLEGTLLEQRDTPQSQLLTLQLGTKVFEAALPQITNGQLPQIAIGSRVSVCGVLQMAPEALRPSESGANPISSEVPFMVWLRTPADVTVLERPPWWTLKRAAGVGSLFACGLFGTLIWVRALRRRVAQRTRELQATMGKLEKETRTSAVLGERDRLAGEIHDSLQQGLAAIILQLDVAHKHAEESPEARRLLRMARGMAEFSRAEVEHAVWDLQSPLLDNADLGTALTHVASLISTGTPQVTVEILGARRPLPSAVEHHLLRIGQEAITNAIKHAQAKHVHLTLNYAGAAVQLSAQDDGVGFVPDAVLKGNGAEHFGLHGIRSRARKLDAQLSISSQPGKGTNITVTLALPLENPAMPPDDARTPT